MPAEKPEGQQTTQYSIIDERGNAVSVTYTLNSWSARAWNLDRNEQRDGGYTLTDGVPWGTAEGILTGAPRLTPGGERKQRRFARSRDGEGSGCSVFRRARSARAGGAS